MKKRIIFVVVLLTSLFASTLAVFAANKAKTVEEALKMEKGTMAHLTGFIDEKLDTGMYLFHDDTGKINLDISDDVWKDRKLEPEKEVKVHGKIDVDDAGINFIRVDKLSLTMKERIKDIF